MVIFSYDYQVGCHKASWQVIEVIFQPNEV